MKASTAADDVEQLQLGSVNWLLLRSLLCGSLPGIVLGSHIATRVPDAVLRLTLAAVLTIVGARLLF